MWQEKKEDLGGKRKEETEKERNIRRQEIERVVRVCCITRSWLYRM